MAIPKYGPNYQGELEGWVYVPYEDKYYRDPAYWMRFYQDRGIIPKQKSSSEMLLDQLTNLGITKAGETVLDEILGLAFGNSGNIGEGKEGASEGKGGSGLLTTLLDKLAGSLFGTTTTGSSTAGSSQGLVSGLFDVVGDAFSSLGNVLFGGGQAASTAPMSIGGVDDLLSYLGITNTASQVPMTVDPSVAGSTAGSFLASRAIPIVSAGISGYSAYKAGEPTPGGFLAGAAMLPFNPVAGILTIGANLLGGLLGGRKKKKKLNKWARQTAKYLSQTTGIEDEDILYHYLRGNYKRLRDGTLERLNKDAYLATLGDVRKKLEDFYKNKNITPNWALIEPELKRMALDILFFGRPSRKRLNILDPSRQLVGELGSLFGLPAISDPFLQKVFA